MILTYKYFLVILILSFYLKLSAQEIKVFGLVKAIEEDAVLSFANVIYHNTSQSSAKVVFTNNQGKFNFEIESKVGDSIFVECTYLGYQSSRKAIVVEQGMDIYEMVFLLEKSSFNIDEIIITDTFPDIVQKEDSIIYNTKAFTDGTEFKLREVLKKTPGFEVTRDDEILYNGEAVKELLVENEKFFNGGTKLGVAYLPANVVSKIEVIEKYNSIGALQGSGTGDRLAINIHLDKEKNKFVFGDALITSNFWNRHRVNANLFYYSPKTRVNTILDYKNALGDYSGKISLFRIFGFNTDQLDPLNIKGDKLDFNNSLLTSNSIYDQEDLFGIGHIVQKISPHFKANILVSGIRNYEYSFSSRYKKYFELENIEQSKDEGINRNLFQYYDVELVYNSPKKNNHLAYNVNFSPMTFTTNDSEDYSLDNEHFLRENDFNSRTLGIYQDAKWIKKWNTKWTNIINAKWQQDLTELTKQWYVEGQNIPDFYTTLGDSMQIRQMRSVPQQEYYVLGQINFAQTPNQKWSAFYRNNLSISEGENKDSYSSGNQLESIENESQLFESHYKFSNLYQSFGLRIDRRNRKYALKVGLEGHLSKAKEYTVAPETRLDIRPYFSLAKTLPKIGEVILEYNFNHLNLSGNYFWDSLYLSNFNSVSSGLSHFSISSEEDFKIQIKRSSVMKGNSLSLVSNFKRRNNPILYKNVLENGYFISRPFLSTLPSDLFISWFNFQKRINSKFTLRLNTTYIFTKYFIDNSKDAKIIRHNVSPRIGIMYNTDFFEFEATYQPKFNNSPSTNSASDWLVTQGLKTEMKLFVSEKIIIYPEFEFDWNKSEFSAQKYILLNTKVQYFLSPKHKFELLCYNLLNSENQIQNYFSSQYLETTNYRLFPRYFSAKYIITF